MQQWTKNYLCTALKTSRQMAKKRECVNPQELFIIILKKSGVLDDETKHELMDAFCSIE